jgi:hypothetical protein
VGILTVLAVCAWSSLLPLSVAITLHAIFIVTVPIAELLILKQAAHRFSEISQPQSHDSIFTSPRSIARRRRKLKFLIGLFVLCLPFGLLQMGSEPHMLLPSIVGAAVNLGITYVWAASLFRLPNEIESN